MDRHLSIRYTRTMEFRSLRRDEIELIWTIDRREFIARMYRVEASELVLFPHEVDVPGWPPDDVRTTTPRLYECHDRGGELAAGLEGALAAGVAVIDIARRG